MAAAREQARPTAFQARHEAIAVVLYFVQPRFDEWLSVLTDARIAGPSS
jgi:hypothetical protein